MRLTDMIPKNAPQSISAKEMAAWFGVSGSSIHRWAEIGLLPKPTRLGLKYVRWDRDELRAWLRRSEALFVKGQPGHAEEPATAPAGDLPCQPNDQYAT